MAVALLLPSSSSAAELISTAQVHITGLKSKSLATINIENSAQTRQAEVNKSGEVNLVGQFSENPEKGISSGVNYTITYEVPYRDTNNIIKTIKNTLTFSFSALVGDVIILGQASDTALIEYASGSSNMQNTTASASGTFNNISIQNKEFRNHKSGTAFVIVTNTQPETGAPLDPVYIEASFSIATPDSKKISTERIKNVFKSFSNGTFQMPNGNINGAWGEGLRDMANELSTNLFAITAAAGTLFDSYSLNQAIAQLQIFNVEAAQRHMPSSNMCVFPTLSKSLARGAFSARATAQIFAKYMQDYDLQHVDSAGAMIDINKDKDYINKLQNLYCHKQQNGADGMKTFCDADPNGGAVNFDINYPALISELQDNGVNLTGTPNTLSLGEVSLFSLTQNIYNSNLRPVKENIMNSPDGGRPITEIRSLQAIRNVAKNSFANLVGGHAKMSGMGGTDQPSYEEMMEELTKKTYQDPAFYAKLYDNPENVMRQKTAIKAVQLMQGWDIVKALHRREMLLAMLLELKLRKEQKILEVNP